MSLFEIDWQNIYYLISIKAKAERDLQIRLRNSQFVNKKHNLQKLKKWKR